MMTNEVSLQKLLKTSANPKAAKKKKKAAEKVLNAYIWKGKERQSICRGLEATERIFLVEETLDSLFDPGLC